MAFLFEQLFFPLNFLNATWHTDVHITVNTDSTWGPYHVHTCVYVSYPTVDPNVNDLKVNCYESGHAFLQMHKSNLTGRSR